MGVEPEKSNISRRTVKKQDPIKLAAILDVARRLFTSRGYLGASMDEVALQAGVGKGTIYRYFTDKEGLFYALVLPELRVLAEESEAIATAQLTCYEKLNRLARCSVTFYARLNPLLSVMFNEASAFSGQHPETQQLNEALRQATASIVRQGVDDGLLSSANIQLAADVFWYLGRVLFYHSPKLFESENSAVTHEEILRLFLNGFGRQRCSESSP